MDAYLQIDIIPIPKSIVQKDRTYCKTSRWTIFYLALVLSFTATPAAPAASLIFLAVSLLEVFSASSSIIFAKSSYKENEHHDNVFDQQVLHYNSNLPLP